MDNGELFQSFDRRVERLEDKVDASVNDLGTKIDNTLEVINTKLDRMFSERNAVCVGHDERIDENDKEIAVIQDRHKEHNKNEVRKLTITGLAVAAFNILTTYLLQKK